MVKKIRKLGQKPEYEQNCPVNKFIDKKGNAPISAGFFVMSPSKCSLVVCILNGCTPFKLMGKNIKQDCNYRLCHLQLKYQGLDTEIRSRKNLHVIHLTCHRI